MAWFPVRFSRQTVVNITFVKSEAHVEFKYDVYFQGFNSISVVTCMCRHGTYRIYRRTCRYGFCPTYSSGERTQPFASCICMNSYEDVRLFSMICVVWETLDLTGGNHLEYSGADCEEGKGKGKIHPRTGHEGPEGE